MLKSCRVWLALVPKEPPLQPRKKRTPAVRRPLAPVRRVSVLDALEHAPGHESEDVLAAPSYNPNPASVPSPSPSPPAASPDTADLDSPYLQSSAFAAAFQQHRAASDLHPSRSRQSHAPSSHTTSSTATHKAQQAALREAYAYADKHHRLRLRKDQRVYAEEVRAFRAAHNGRRPSAKEVSPFTDVSLPPVTALRAVAHLDPRTSAMHQEVQESLLLQQAITRSELMKSNERTLVRCLSCFHVYGARPRELWGGEDGSAHGGSGQQSWIALEREKRQVAHAERLAHNPRLRKRLSSIGRRQAREASSPVVCPKCGSPRAQWAMEYVHYRTHAK